MVPPFFHQNERKGCRIYNLKARGQLLFRFYAAVKKGQLPDKTNKTKTKQKTKTKTKNKNKKQTKTNKLTNKAKSIPNLTKTVAYWQARARFLRGRMLL